MDIELVKLCLTVFGCRILDVTFCTVRTIQVVRGKRGLAMLFGFFETFVWFTIVREALQFEGSSIFLALAYALGFASGTGIGMLITDRFIKSNICMQVVTSSRDTELIQKLREAGYGVSVVEVMGSEFADEKYMLFVEIEHHDERHVRSVIAQYDPKAFVSVQETKMVYGGYFR